MAQHQSLDQALAKIEKARQARQGKFYLRDEAITLSHGSGGKAMHSLIAGVMGATFANPTLDRMDDAAVLKLADTGARLAFTTDSYVVSPIFFPGGDIGKLAVYGTVNDLAMAGAQPRWLSVGLILEEGLAIDDLQRIVHSMQAAASEAGVQIVTGDTKVVSRGQADKIFINTAGIGLLPHAVDLSALYAQPGDQVLLSGPLGDHGIAILLAREALELEADVQSDTAPLHSLVADLLAAAGPGLHCLKDPTRGGLASALNEIALSSAVAIALEERAIPVNASVRGACEILGLDPLTIANEGKLIAVVAADVAAAALAALRAHPLGQQAALIGEVRPEPSGMVFLRTELGGARVLDMLVGDPLPRIC
jgi:hydrogenase expression/formation protein HypE